MHKLVELIKKISAETIENNKPVSVIYGTVIGIEPLKIQIEQKLVLIEKDLILTDNVQNFETEITVMEWFTENMSGGSGDSSFASHNHELKGRKKIIVHNSLKVGEKVILLREQKGQKYVVLNRVR